MSRRDKAAAPAKPSDKAKARRAERAESTPAAEPAGDVAAQDPPAQPAARVAELELALIDRDPDLNPRTHFDEEELQGLADSIRDKGLVQPILVRPYNDLTGRYRLVAGERRFRASQLAGLTAIPAIVRELDDAQAREIALIENVQRVDLHPLEEARCFKLIIEAKTEQDPAVNEAEAKRIIAEATRKTTRYIEQRLDLLELPEKAQERMMLPESDSKYLSVTNARYEVQSIRREERERQEKRLEPRALLIMAELIDKIDKDPAKLENWYYSSKPTEVSYDIGGEEVDFLVEKNFISIQRGWRNDGRTYINLGYSYSKKDLVAQLPAFGGAKRKEALDQLRAEVLGGWNVLSGLYATAWLNGPFEPDPAKLEEVRKAEEQRAEQRRQEAERAAKVEARRTAAREAAEAATTLFTELAGGPATDGMAKADELLEKLEIGGPYSVDDEGAVVCANGGVLLQPAKEWDSNNRYSATDRAVATAHLLALALNALTGTPVPARAGKVKILDPDTEIRIKGKKATFAITAAMESAPGGGVVSYLARQLKGDGGLGQQVQISPDEIEEVLPVSRRRFEGWIARRLVDVHEASEHHAGGHARRALDDGLAVEGCAFGDDAYSWGEGDAHDMADSYADAMELQGGDLQQPVPRPREDDAEAAPDAGDVDDEAAPTLTGDAFSQQLRAVQAEAETETEAA